MSANDRLQTMQSALKARGLRDVKFCFSLKLAAMPGSVVAGGVADFLDAYLKDRAETVERIGDSAVTQA